MALGRLGLAAGLVALGACGGAGAPAPRPDAGPGLGLEVGTGAVAYEPLAPGGALRVYRGPQGGYHVFAGFRADWASDEDDVTVTSELELGGAFAARGGGRVPMAAGAGGGRVLYGLPVYFHDDEVGRGAAGRTGRLWIEVRDAEGRYGRGELEVTCVREP